MGTRLRQWAIRLLAAVALPITLTLGLSAAAYAQTTHASQVKSTEHRSGKHLSTQPSYNIYGPFYYYDDCRDAQYEVGGYASACVVQYRYDDRGEYHVWYLYTVGVCGCGPTVGDSRHLIK